MTAPTRSCPTCHSAGEPRGFEVDGVGSTYCTDPWHDQTGPTDRPASSVSAERAETVPECTPHDDEVNLTALECLTNATSPAPWSIEDNHTIRDANGEYVIPAVAAGGHWPSKADGRWIVATRNHLPALLAEVTQLREDNQRLRGQIAAGNDTLDDWRNRAEEAEAELAAADQRFEAYRAELHQVLAERDRLRAELVGYDLEAFERQRQTIAEVRKHHPGPRTERYGSGCIGCGRIWPCPTIAALDADPDTDEEAPDANA